jgi:uncharacterized membrane protein HdeD (DUF308 family)
MSNGDSTVPAPARRRAEILDLLAGLVAVALLVLVFADRVGAARMLLAVLFAFFVPGRAIVSNWPRMADWSGIGMSIALSIGALTLLAMVCLWARIWHPLALFQIEAAASLIALGIAVARRRSSARPRLTAH